MSGTEASAHAAVGECADLPMCGRSRLNVRLAPARTASHEVGLATEGQASRTWVVSNRLGRLASRAEE
jgi:hypothetical protein